MSERELNKGYTRAVVYALLLGWYALFSAEIVDFIGNATDVPRHLKNAELLLSPSSPPGTAWRILHTNIYSYTNPDFPFVNHHWLADLVYYPVWRLADFEGLNLFYIALGALTFTLFFRLAERAAGLAVASAIAVPLIPVVRARPSIRPEIFTLLLAGVFLSLLWSYWERRRDGRLLWLLPVLEVFWVNLHLGFILGPIFVAAFLAWERSRRLLVVFALTAAATLLNPSGLAGAIYPLMFWRNYSVPVLENFSVPQALRAGLRNDFVAPMLALIVMLLSFALPAIRRKRFPWPLAALATITGALGFFSIRNLPVMGLVAIATIGINLGRVSLRRAGAATAIVVVILAGASYGVRRLALRSAGIGLGPPPDARMAAEFLASSNLQGPLFNSYDTGGYLIQYAFPRFRVFIDSRPEAYPSDFIKEKFLGALADEERWLRLVEEYRFDAIFFSVRSIPDRNFIARRLVDPAWANVFFQNDIFILARRTATNESLIRRYEILRGFQQVR